MTLMLKARLNRAAAVRALRAKHDDAFAGVFGASRRCARS